MQKLVSRKEYEALLNFVSLAGECLFNLIVDIENQTNIDINPQCKKYVEYLKEMNKACNS